MTLQDRIVSIVKQVVKQGRYPTCDELLNELNARASTRTPSKPELQKVLRAMRASGRIEMRTDRRYYVTVGRYSCDSMLDTWRVWRKHPDIADHDVCIAASMTEAEARTCVTALNELDRKVRAMKGG